MGATDFNTLASGRDAAEAFRNAVEQARYEHGHGGYTGTIAEKSDFRLVACPSRVKSCDLASWIFGHETTPEAHQGLVDRLQAICEDKWGPCVAIELVGQDLATMKARMGLEGTQAKIFRFVGTASC